MPFGSQYTIRALGGTGQGAAFDPQRQGGCIGPRGPMKGPSSPGRQRRGPASGKKGASCRASGERGPGDHARLAADAARTCCPRILQGSLRSFVVLCSGKRRREEMGVKAKTSFVKVSSRHLAFVPAWSGPVARDREKRAEGCLGSSPDILISYMARFHEKGSRNWCTTHHHLTTCFLLNITVLGPFFKKRQNLGK